MSQSIYFASKENIFTYLDNLRESGITNMFGASAYLEQEFDLTKQEAKAFLIQWMESFQNR